MPANLELLNGKIQMIYATEGGLPWWGEGGVRIPGESLTVGDIATHLPTLLAPHEKVPHYVWVPNSTLGPNDKGYYEPSPGLGSLRKMHGFYDIRRSGDFKPIGVVKSRYTIIQPRDIVESCMEVIFQNGLRLETAGSLNGGARMWFQARIPGDYSIRQTSGNEDTMLRFCLFISSFDGSGAFTVKPTTVRVVCKNTADIALRENGKKWSIPHTASAPARIQALNSSVRSALGYFDELVEFERTLESRRLSGEDAQLFFAELVGLTDLIHDAAEKAKTEEFEESRKVKSRVALVEELVDYFANSPGNQGLTERDALNAVTYYTTHKQTRRLSEDRKRAGYTPDFARFESSILGDDPLTARAISLLQKRAA